MPTFHYIAKDQNGDTKTGLKEAKNDKELARLLKEEGLFLVSPGLEAAASPKFNFLSLFGFGKRVSLSDKIFFSRYLSVMLSAGIPITKALNLLGNQVKSKNFKKIIFSCQEDIEKGSALNKAFSKAPDIFSELYVNMIRVGEEGGNLEEVLNLLADQMQKELELKAKIQGAMMYPMVIVFAMVGIGFFMVVTVVPKLSEVFTELNIALPPTTQFIIFFGNFAAKYWYLFPLFVAILFFGVRAILRTESGKRIFARLLLFTPFIRGLVRKINSTQMSRTLSSLIKGGVPIVQALNVTSRTLGNYFFRKSLEEIAKKVEKGATINKAFAEFPNVFPDLLIGMMEVGEETGTLSENLIRLADFYEDDVSRVTANLSSIIEPILMIFIGAVVGFFAISMIQPMYSMLEAI